MHAYISLRGDEGVKKCTRAFRACCFTAWSSRLKCIKSDRKNQDMGGRKCIYLHFILLKSHKECSFSSKISTVTNVILILYNSSINNKLISRDLHFRHHIACFCSISLTKKLFLTATAMFCVSEQHDGDSFLNESMNRLNDSVQSQWLTC